MFIMLDGNVNLFLKEFEQKKLSYHSDESYSVEWKILHLGLNSKIVLLSLLIDGLCPVPRNILL